MPYRHSVLVLLLLAALPSLARAQAVQTILPLTVMNGSDEPRVNEPVSFGVPVGQENQVYGLDFLQIVDSNLQPIPRQFKVLTRWGGARDDTSKPIRWALVTFNANVPANGTATYYAALGGPPAPGGLYAADLAPYIEVHTTPTTYFRISKSAFTLFDAAVVNGTPVVTPGRTKGSM